MENRVLYEASFSVSPSSFMPLIMLVVFICITVHYARAEKRGAPKTEFGIGIGALGSIVFLVVLAFVIPNQIRMYRATVGAYQRGDYQIVEGYVEDFHPMPAQGHDQESFTVNGVEFEYSDYTEQFGYHNARSLGGVITGDGQHLKIGYTNYQWLGNVIVYIEELP